MGSTDNAFTLGNSTYVISAKVSADFEEAQRVCSSLNPSGHLAEFETLQELRSVQSLLPQFVESFDLMIGGVL